jgi:hypothetical protein
MAAILSSLPSAGIGALLRSDLTLLQADLAIASHAPFLQFEPFGARIPATPLHPS